MAFTKSVQYVTAIGNKRQISLLVTADANSGSVETGLQVIEAVHATVVSAATGAQKFKKNLSAASATANGTLFMSSCTNGDAFEVVVTGR